MRTIRRSRIDPFVMLLSFIISLVAFFVFNAAFTLLTGQGLWEWFLTLSFVRYSPLTYAASSLVVTALYFAAWYYALVLFPRLKKYRKK